MRRNKNPKKKPKRRRQRCCGSHRLPEAEADDGDAERATASRYPKPAKKVLKKPPLPRNKSDDHHREVRRRNLGRSRDPEQNPETRKERKNSTTGPTVAQRASPSAGNLSVSLFLSLFFSKRKIAKKKKFLLTSHDIILKKVEMYSLFF